MTTMFIALVLTILIETPIAWALGYRSRNETITVVLASVITNPPLNFIIALAAYEMTAGAPLILVLEAAVVIAEWRILLYALGGDSRRHFKTS
ncbi:MAG TPA: hypothetical protein DC017_14800, partial [Candidatus Wallbacteria bacterium]|nr:hypothetical protein [Candidatus Wallbacteria bacterium]